ncbi:hypothetical protein D3C81_1665830 [compost metagenome]
MKRDSCVSPDRPTPCDRKPIRRYLAVQQAEQRCQQIAVFADGAFLTALRHGHVRLLGKVERKRIGEIGKPETIVS